MEEDQLTAKDNFPAITGNNEIGRILSIAEMISLTNNVPFRKDALSKIVASKLKRDLKESLEMYAGICEYMTLNTTIAETNPEYISSLEFPVIAYFDSRYVVL